MSQVTGRKTSLSSRSSSVMSRRSNSTLLTDQVKENQLQWMFNRRKSQLARTSAQNVQLYLRIKSQKSGLAKMLGKSKVIDNGKSRIRLVNNK